MGELVEGTFWTTGRLDGNDWQVRAMRFQSRPPVYPMDEDGKFYVEIVDDTGESVYIGFFTPEEVRLSHSNARLPKSYSFSIPAYETTSLISIRDSTSGEIQYQYALEPELKPEVSLLTTLSAEPVNLIRTTS